MIIIIGVPTKNNKNKTLENISNIESAIGLPILTKQSYKGKNPNGNMQKRENIILKIECL